MTKTSHGVESQGLADLTLKELREHVGVQLITCSMLHGLGSLYLFSQHGETVLLCTTIVISQVLRGQNRRMGMFLNYPHVTELSSSKGRQVITTAHMVE